MPKAEIAAPKRTTRRAARCDVTVLSSSRPAGGRTVFVTLLAETPQALPWPEYKALQCQSGVAPLPRHLGTPMGRVSQ